MNKNYSKIDIIYKKIYDLLSTKKISQFNINEIYLFKNYFEELIKLLADIKDIKLNIKFTYKYTKKEKQQTYRLFQTNETGELEIDLDEIITTQEKEIKAKSYDIDLFITQVILTSAMHETIHLKQIEERRKKIISLENYLISKKIYADSCLYRRDKSRFLSYCESLEEGTAHFDSISFVLDFLEKTKKYKTTQKILNDAWTWNNFFIYYYSKIPFEYQNGILLNNEERSNQIIKNTPKTEKEINFMLSIFPILSIEIDQNGNPKDVISILEAYFKEKEHKNKKELLKIYYYILISKLENYDIKTLIQKHGKEEIFILMRELYSVTEEMKVEYQKYYNKLLKVISNPNFEIESIKNYGIVFSKEILDKKYKACLMDVNIKQSIIDDSFKQFKGKSKI